MNTEQHKTKRSHYDLSALRQRWEGVVGYSTILKLIASGHMNATLVGKKYVVPSSEVERFDSILSGEAGVMKLTDELGRSILTIIPN